MFLPLKSLDQQVAKEFHCQADVSSLTLTGERGKSFSASETYKVRLINLAGRRRQLAIVEIWICDFVLILVGLSKDLELEIFWLHREEIKLDRVHYLFYVSLPKVRKHATCRSEQIISSTTSL